MRMRQSLDDLERAFAEEISLERHRRRSLVRSTQQRTYLRHVQRRKRHGSMRFVLLVLSLIFTAVVVTVVMFRVLDLLLA
jgi:hypothetical protein